MKKEHEEFIVDDRVIIPDYIQKMSLEELEREIAKLEREHAEKKRREKDLAIAE